MSDSSSNTGSFGPEMDEDLKFALEAFGDDLLDILDEDDEPVAECDASLLDLDTDTPLDSILQKYGDRLNGNSSLAYAGSIAMACHTAGKSDKVDSRFIVFAVGPQRFGIPLSCVSEVAQCPTVTPLPGTSAWLKGVACLRGALVSVTDLQALFELPRSDNKRKKKLLVFRSPLYQSSTALWIDRIHGIKSLVKHPTPESSGEMGLVLSGIAEFEDHAISLIDPDLLLGCSKLMTYRL